MKKIKNRMFCIILSSVLTLLPMFVGIFSWNTLPDELPIHFNFSGEAYGYADKLKVIVVLPLFVLVMHLVIVFATMPDSASSVNIISNKVYLLLLLIAPLVSIFCTVMIFTDPLNLKFDLLTIIQVFLAIIYLIIGNYLPKIHRNKFVGTKLLWTIKSEYNWDKTNRLTGWLFFILGLVFLLNIFIRIGNGSGVFILWLVSVFVVTVIPTLYSYILSKKEEYK